MPSKIPQKFLSFFFYGAIFAASSISQTVSARPGSAPRAVTGNTQIVSTLPQLLKTLRDAKQATTILVSPGSYGTFIVNNLQVPPGTIVKSAKGADLATFQGLSFDNVSGLRFQDVDIVPSSKTLIHGRYAALVTNSRHLQFVGVRFRAPKGGLYQKFPGGLMLRGDSNILIQRSYFGGFKHGLMMLDASHLLIENNEFENLQTDAIRGGGVRDSVIQANVLTDFHPKRGDHPDGIQLWSNNQKRPGRNIRILDNLIVRGSGQPVQGIFIRDTRLTMPFENLKIAGNLVIGALYNGISVGGANGAEVRENTVIPLSGQKSWIRLEQTRNAVAEKNYAGSFIFRNNKSKPVSKQNTIISANGAAFAGRISRWVRQRKAFSVYRGPVLQRLMRNTQ